MFKIRNMEENQGQFVITLTTGQCIRLDLPEAIKLKVYLNQYLAYNKIDKPVDIPDKPEWKGV